MSNAEIRGRFVWHELMTTDPQAAGAFYSKVLTWKTQPSGMPDYTLWVSGKAQAGGLMAQPESAWQSGAPPSWLIYIGTPDIDGTAAAAERLGGKVLKAPADIPNVGRFAVLADPQGAAFALFAPNAMPEAGATASDFSWHELATSDQEGAIAFYSELFGWGRGPAHDMGSMGTYQLIEHGGAQIGGVYKVMDASKPPHWLTYIRVTSVDEAAAAAKAAGGRVTQGPMEVPGGSRVAQILDPQGGAFAVHEPARQPAPASAPKRKSGAASDRAAAKGRRSARKTPVKRAATAKKAARPATSRVRPGPRGAAVKAKKRPAAAKRGARKSPARKSPARKSPARKSPARKSPARKSPARKSPARKPAAKRPAARKAAGKKSARRRR